MANWEVNLHAQVEAIGRRLPAAAQDLLDRHHKAYGQRGLETEVSVSDPRDTDGLRHRRGAARLDVLDNVKRRVRLRVRGQSSRVSPSRTTMIMQRIGANQKLETNP